MCTLNWRSNFSSLFWPISDITVLFTIPWEKNSLYFLGNATHIVSLSLLIFVLLSSPRHKVFNCLLQITTTIIQPVLISFLFIYYITKQTLTFLCFLLTFHSSVMSMKNNNKMISSEILYYWLLPFYNSRKHSYKKYFRENVGHNHNILEWGFHFSLSALCFLTAR